jgi:hypothetical protein
VGEDGVGPLRFEVRIRPISILLATRLLGNELMREFCGGHSLTRPESAWSARGRGSVEEMSLCALLCPMHFHAHTQRDWMNLRVKRVSDCVL